MNIFQRLSDGPIFRAAITFQFNPSALATVRVTPSVDSAQFPKTKLSLNSNPDIKGIQPSPGGVYTTCGVTVPVRPSSRKR